MKSLKRRFNRKNVISFLGNAFCYIVLFGIIFLVLYPLIEKSSNIFKNADDLIDKTVLYIPKEPTLDTLKTTLSAMKYWSALLNTVALSGGLAIIQVLICTLISYGLARFKFLGNRLLFLFVIIALIIPPQVIITALYLIFQGFDIAYIFRTILGKPLELIGTPLPLIMLSLTGLGYKNSLYIFMMRQFFKNMPVELEEAGTIDGAGTFMVFRRIMLPEAASMMVTIFMFAFSWQWTDGYFTTLLMNDVNVLSNSLSLLQSYGKMTISPIMRTAIIDTGLILIIIPLLLLYLVGQKFFVEGVSRSGIVG